MIGINGTRGSNGKNGHLIRVRNFIDGEFEGTDQYLESFNPAKDKVWALVPDSSPEEMNRAVTAAKIASRRWGKTSIQERSRILLKVADLMEANLDQFAEMESRDQGKPVSLARTIDIPRAIHNFRFFANGVINQLNISTFQDNTNALNYTMRSAVGVAGLISPWNLPLYLLTFKLAPALACGNTVVCKPSEMTSVTAWMLCGVFKEAGIPPGVVNMVFGTGPRAGDALVRHPDINLISFTGSTMTAEKIRSACVNQCKKLSLELGGKNAAIIFDDADMEKCIPNVIRSAFINQGEVCLCTSRIFIQRAVYDTVLGRLVEEAMKLRVGDPSDSDTWMGALVSREHREKVVSYIDIAEQEGGVVVTGRERERLKLSEEFAKGYFVAPTIVTQLKDTSRLMQEEIFGPVICAVPFDTEEEVIERVNDVPYGLCASVWSANVNVVHRMARHLDVGTVWANCWLLRDLHMPFGGIKASGVGREGLADSVDFYTEVKTVCVQLEHLLNDH